MLSIETDTLPLILSEEARPLQAIDLLLVETLFNLAEVPLTPDLIFTAGITVSRWRKSFTHGNQKLEKETEEKDVSQCHHRAQSLGGVRRKESRRYHQRIRPPA